MVLQRVRTVPSDRQSRARAPAAHPPSGSNTGKKRERCEDALFPLAGELDQGGEAKVAHAEVHVGVEHEVAQLEVAVNDRVGVHVVAGADELRQVEARFGFRVALADAEEVEEGLGGSWGA